MERKFPLYVVSSARMADYLIHMGLKILRINRDKKDCQRLVFVFAIRDEVDRRTIERWELDRDSYKWG